MKLVRFGTFRKEKPGVIDISGQRRDCSGHFSDWNSIFFNDGGLDKLREIDIESLPLVPEKERWGAPVARANKLLCIGLNYIDHAVETNSKVPVEPMLFMKATNTTVGPFDNVIIPKNSSKTDYEVELALIIESDCSYLQSPEQARDFIAGYTISNDVSEREFQKERCGQFCKGKSCDTFNPLGPYLITSDELTRPEDHKLELKVNGKVRQSSSTSAMIFKPDYIVYYLSQFMTLEAGDIISTGTPPGVAMGMNSDGYLKAGDVIETTVESLGSQKNRCVKHS